MAKKMVIPMELKLDFFKRAYFNTFKTFLYAIREEYGAVKALEIYKKVAKMEDRMKNLTNFFRTVFKLQGNDAETIGKWYDIFCEIIGQEVTTLERSKTIERRKVTKCPLRTEYKDISDWVLVTHNVVIKTINPKATVERLKGMCAGDPYCEYIFRIEEGTSQH